MSDRIIAFSDDELSLRDNELIRLAASGFTPAQIEETLGMDGAKAVQRIKEILASTDVFTSLEKKKLLIQSAYELKRQIEAVLDHSKPREVDAYVKVLRLLSDALDKTEKLSGEELEAAARAQAVQMVRLFEASWTRARQLLATEYPQVDADSIESAFREGLYAELEA